MKQTDKSRKDRRHYRRKGVVYIANTRNNNKS